MVYALVRHELNFQAGAVSSSGARGLMQIMPSTAHAVAGEQAQDLHKPEVNLAIGQQLMLTLADDDVIDGDLIRLLAGYGQGQGGLRKWVDAVRDGGDPLMFVEAIPNGNTSDVHQGRPGVFLALRGATAASRVQPGRAGRRPLSAVGARGRGREICQRRCLRHGGRAMMVDRAA